MRKQASWERNPSPRTQAQARWEGSERGRRETQPALPRLVAHLLPPPAGRVCGPRWPGRRLGFPRSLARPNSAPFLVEQRPPPAQAAMPPPAAGTASESGGSKPGGGERPRNARRSTEGARCCASRDALGRGESTGLGARRSSSSAVRRRRPVQVRGGAPTQVPCSQTRPPTL